MAVTSVIAANTWDRVTAALAGDLGGLSTTRRWDGTVDSKVTGHDGTGEAVKGLNDYSFFYGVADSFNAFVVSFWWKIDSAAGDVQVCQFDDGATFQVRLERDNATGFLRVETDSTSWLATDTAISTGTWYQIEWGVVIDPAAGKFDVRVDGAAVGGLSQSGVDTAEIGGSASSNHVAWNGGANANLDECVISAHASTYDADDLVSGADGAGSRVASLLPDAVGNYPGTTDWTTGWTDSVGTGAVTVDMVNDDPIDFSDLVATRAQNARVSFKVDDLPSDVDGVLTVFSNAWMSCRVGGETLRVFLRSGGTDTDGTTETVLDANAKNFRDEFTGPWTVADINAIEVGAQRITAANSDEVRVYHLELEVAYLKSPPGPLDATPNWAVEGPLNSFELHTQSGRR